MTRRLKDSLTIAFEIIGGIATVFTIFGVSVSTVFPLPKVNWVIKIEIYIFIVAFIYAFFVFAIWTIIGRKYKDSITFQIGRNTVTVKPGDIFKTSGWRVIPMDTTFSIDADDKVISKNSLHGKLVLEHGNADEIKKVVKSEAERRGFQEDNGIYRFPFGAVIPYVCKEKDGQDASYLMVAMTALNENWEAHTNMAQYEHTLMEMWKEISRVYARNDIVLPLMGSGITRFDDNQDDPGSFLRCMLCTLNTSKLHLNSKITVLIYDDGKTNIPLYEYKELFRIARCQ
ncbi:MAG: hypothetical protein HFI70_10100 [Lachnospiraceae bacterium]|nr:hypothetical protein [Lachnospiraceae bacterium]